MSRVGDPPDLDEGWDEDAPGSVLETSNPKLAELDGGWGEDDDDAEEGAPAGAAQRPRPKKARPKRASREVRAQRQRAVEEKREAARLAKQEEIEAKRKRKQPREKRPPRTEPNKRERRAAEAASLARRGDDPQVFTPDGPPDLQPEEGTRRRRGTLQDARKSASQSPSALPPWAGYLVLLVLVGGAIAYFVLGR